MLLEGGQVVDRFQSLMKTGAWIPPFITELTGISNAMLQDAPSADAVMRDAARFVGKAPMVAHNASFDSKFWQAELQLADVPAPQPFACTVLLSRRLYPQAPSHRLGALAETLLAAGLPVVVDAASLRRDERQALQMLAARQAVDFSLVVCSAPPERLRERIEARQAQGDDPSDATVEVLALQQRVQEPLTPDERRHAVQVVNDGPLPALEAQVDRLAAAWAAPQGV